MDKTFLDGVLIKAQGLNSSDIHFSTNLPPYIRAQGDIFALEGYKNLSAKEILEMMYIIMDDHNREALIKNLQVDFAYYNKENKTRYRVNVFQSIKGISAVFRQLNTTIPKLEDMNFPEIFKKIAFLEKGLVLICGPTGSGKSTTLAILIDYINRHKKKHIITIEDPVEYVYETKTSLVDQREVGRSVKNFADGLRGALREDPDIILVGEMRDPETIKMALTAAETGHLVFATLHTMSISKSIDRILDSYESAEKGMIKNMLSTSLQAAILQTLLKNTDNTGRIAAFEILVSTPAVRNMIRENKIYQLDSVIQTGAKNGMVTMQEYVKNLLKNNLVNREEALSKLTRIEDVEYGNN